MKKASLLTAALISLGLVSQASADTTVYLTGSTAFRSLVYKAITTSGRVFDGAPDYESDYNGSAANKCNYMLFHGTISGTPIYLDCAWSGSDAGLGSVLNMTIDNDGAPLFGSPAKWLQPNPALLTSGYNSGVPTSGQLESSSHQADLAFADTSILGALQVIQNQNKLTPLHAYGQVGVAAFTWAKNNNNASAGSTAKGAWDNLNNINWYQEQALFGAGQLPADYFTGNFTNNTTDVYLIGRNKGSGTRANVLLDCGLTPDSTVIQFNVGGGLNTSPSLALSLDVNGGGVNTDGGIDQNDGYESGGNVAKALNVAGSSAQADPFSANTGWIAIGYLSCGDASGIGGQADVTSNWLTENGVKESSATVTTGQYSYWGYENFYGKPGITGIQSTTGTKIVNGVKTTIGTDGNGGVSEHTGDINLNYMHAQKQLDYSYPTHL